MGLIVNSEDEKKRPRHGKSSGHTADPELEPGDVGYSGKLEMLKKAVDEDNRQ